MRSSVYLPIANKDTLNMGWVRFLEQIISKIQNSKYITSNQKSRSREKSHDRKFGYNFVNILYNTMQRFCNSRLKFRTDIDFNVQIQY